MSLRFPLTRINLQVNSKLLKHPQEVSRFSSHQLLSYVQNVEKFSRASRAGATDIGCYNHYLPLIGKVPEAVNDAIGVCTTALNEGTQTANGKLVTAKSSADSSSNDVEEAVSSCGAITDPKDGLQCHSKQVSFNSHSLNLILIIISFYRVAKLDQHSELSAMMQLKL